MRGFVKLRRSLRRSPCWKMGDPYKGLIADLLMMAAWEPEQAWDGEKLVDVPVGSLWTTLRDLSAEVNLPLQRLRTALKNLEKVGFLNTQTNTRGTLITILKYEGSGDTQHADQHTIQHADQHTVNTRSTHPPSLHKEIKKGAKTKKSKSSPLPDGWTPTPSHLELARSLGVNCTHEAAKFRDWALAKDERKVRWDAAFSGWLRRSSEYRNGKPAPPKPEEKSLSEKMRERGML